MKFGRIFKQACGVLGAFASVTACQDPDSASLDSKTINSTISSQLVPFVESRPGNSRINSFSWDGRLYSGTITDGQDADGNNIGVISIGAFLPEAMPAGDVPATGIPNAALSTAIALYTSANEEPVGHITTQPISIVPYLGVPENPYRSLSDGGKDARGNYETYDAVIFAYRSVPAVPANSGLSPVPINNYLVRGRWWITVQYPRTASATISRLRMINDFAPVRTIDNPYIYGIEPTATIDTRLIVFQSHGAALSYIWLDDPTMNSTQQRWTEPKGLASMYTAEANTVIAGLNFKDRYPIAAQPLLDASGSPFDPAYNYPGAYPWLSLDGSEIFHTTMLNTNDKSRRSGASVIGQLTNYTLRLIDGPANPNLYLSRRQTSAPLGPFPSMWAPYADVPNSPFPGSPRRPLYLDFEHNTKTYNEIALDDGKDPDYLVYLHMNQMITHSLVRDGAYALATVTNGSASYQGITADAASDGHIRTPDTSGRFSTQKWLGNFNSGELRGGARFPAEPADTDPTHYPSVNVGKSGQAILFPPGSSVFVANHAQNLNKIQSRLSAQLWFKCLDASTCAGKSILSSSGQYVISIEGNHLFAKIFLRAAGAYISLRSDSNVAPIMDGQFHAIGLSYDANTNNDAAGGALKFYIDGVLNSSVNTTGVNINDRYVAVGGSTLSVVLGPNPSVGAPGSNEPTGADIYILDEFALSDVARTDAEFQTAAFLKPAPQTQDVAAFTSALPAAVPPGINIAFIQVPASNPITSAAVDLGKKLFFDPRLSQDSAVSCASCHLPTQAFSDVVQFSSSYNGTLGKRNTSPITNRVFANLQMRDGSADSLESQVLLPLHSVFEMGLNIDSRRDAMIARLKSVPQYVTAFNNVYSITFSSLLTTDAEFYVAQAISSYERTLLSGNSRVDQFEARNATALTPQEQNGRVLFRGKARCISCHNGMNYTDELFHNSGFFSASTTDHGRWSITLRSSDMNRFKTPSLRNIGSTGPYFHDGTLTTLEGIIDLYNAPPNSDGMADPLLFPLGLSASEKADLKAFLLALSGDTLNNDPPTLP